MTQLTDAEIRILVEALDTTQSEQEKQAWIKLTSLGEDVLPYFVEAYSNMNKWQGRASMLFFATRFSRKNEHAFKLGLAALEDKATLVRSRACGLLAYSLRNDAVPHLRKLLDHTDKKTNEAAKAAIDAIENLNHHYFIDRTHSGAVYWKVQEGDVPEAEESN